MMYRHYAFIAKTREQGTAVIFGVSCKGWKIHHNKIRKRQKGEWNRDKKELMRFIRLQNISNRRNHVRHMRGQEKFSEAAIDKSKRWNGIRQNQTQREQKKK